MITRVSTLGMTKEDWLQERSSTIGGSEIGAILGLNPWQSAYSLWCERTGKTPPFEGNLTTDFGSFMEQFVADVFERRSGLTCRKTNFIWRNDRFPALHASPDRLIQGLGAGLECKTTSAWNAGKFHGVEFPSQYYAQAVQYMAVLEVALWYIAVLVGNNEFHIYQLTRDPAIAKPDWCDASLTVEDAEIDALSKAADEFLDCCKRGVAPAIDGSEATADALKTVYATAGEGQVDLFGRQDLLDEWDELKTRMDELDKRKTEIQNTLCADLGECQVGVCGGRKVTWKLQSRSTLDTKALKKDLPDIDARYRKAGTCRVFKIA